MPAIPNPLSLLAEVTYRCPLHCPYCSNPLELRRYRDELDTETWRRVLGEAAALGVVQKHSLHIDRAYDVDIMQDERLRVWSARWKKKPACFFQASSGVEQGLFAGNLDVHPEVIVLPQILNDHVGEVVDTLSDDQFQG